MPRRVGRGLFLKGHTHTPRQSTLCTGDLRMQAEALAAGNVSRSSSSSWNIFPLSGQISPMTSLNGIRNGIFSRQFGIILDKVGHQAWRTSIIFPDDLLIFRENPPHFPDDQPVFPDDVRVSGKLRQSFNQAWDLHDEERKSRAVMLVLCLIMTTSR